MKLRSRTFVYFCLVFSLIGLVAVFPEQIRELGLDFWNTPLETDDPHTVSQRLDAVQAKVLKRNALKNEVIADLIGERLTLAQATGQFLQLAEGESMINDAVAARFPAATLEESTRLHVISAVTSSLTYCPTSNGEEIIARLRAEARHLKAKK